MQRFDRTLGILLFLRSKPSVSAAALARQFDVSTRTIYRDLETQNPTIVLELLRWLGPGAELLEPHAWREGIREELRQMLASYPPQ